MKPLLIFGIATILAIGVASAAVEDDVLADLNSYYQASVDENLITFMSYMVLDCDEHDCNAIAADIEDLWERIDTTSVEIYGAEVAAEDEDAAVHYNITAAFVVRSDEGTFYELTQDYELMAYMLKEEGAWRVAYIMPQVIYEEAKVNMGPIPTMVDMALEGEEDIDELYTRGEIDYGQSGTQQPGANQGGGDNSLLVAVIAVGIVVAILLLFVFFRMRSKAPASKGPRGSGRPPEPNKVCRSCGTTNPQNAQFCQNCGKELR